MNSLPTLPKDASASPCLRVLFTRAFRLCGATLCLLLLCGCFDLTQKLSIGRDGAGRYDITIAANGLLGEALKDNKTALQLKQNNVRTRTVAKNGFVTQTVTMDFQSLAALRLSDESLSLTNHGASWFGLGPSHVTFRRVFLVDRARRENAPRQAADNKFGTELAQTMFGDHVYVFSVTVPGSVDRAATIHIGHTTIQPRIVANGVTAQTVTWRMPLYAMLQAKLLTFEIDFSAYGSFPDAQSLPVG
jgi:hypothetical protein